MQLLKYSHGMLLFAHTETRRQATAVVTLMRPYVLLESHSTLVELRKLPDRHSTCDHRHTPTHHTKADRYASTPLVNGSQNALTCRDTLQRIAETSILQY